MPQNELCHKITSKLRNTLKNNIGLSLIMCGLQPYWHKSLQV